MPFIESALSSGQLAAIRDRPYRADYYFLVWGGNTPESIIVFKARVNQASFTTSFATITFDTVTKGAFTDASEDRLGRFQAADGGTIFLDEIGNLPLHLQAKLMRVLEQRKVTPVGSDDSQDIDVRVVAATNVPPATLKNEDHFRQDLLFRLNTVEITVPPLRDRKDDILPIADHYGALYSQKYGGKMRTFSPEARQAARPPSTRSTSSSRTASITSSLRSLCRSRCTSVSRTSVPAADSPVPRSGSTVPSRVRCSPTTLYCRDGCTWGILRPWSGPSRACANTSSLTDGKSKLTRSSLWQRSTTWSC